MPATKEIDFERKDQLERKRRENEARQPISMVTPTGQLCLEQGISRNLPHCVWRKSGA
jgi:DNA-binding MarR family transcriptional regulator